MGNVIYSFMAFEKKSVATMACSSYDRDWILAEAQRIADDFDAEIEVMISLPEWDKPPIARMHIYPRKQV